MSDQAEQLQHESIVREDEEIREEDVHDHVVLVTGARDGKVDQAEEGKNESLLPKLHRSDSSSSGSSSDEEVEGEKKKKKKEKGIKEKIVIDDEGKRKEEAEDTEVVVEKVEAIRVLEQSAVAPEEEEKKGFLEKIKEKIMEKLPGYHKTDQLENEGAKKN